MATTTSRATAAHDVVFGNLGQDDIVGGSSSLFGLESGADRIDGDDTLYGGAGTDVAFGTFGDLSAEGHALDADVILGDNGNIYRIVGTNGSDSGDFLSFTYDDYSATEDVIVRAYEILDEVYPLTDVTSGGLTGEAGIDPTGQAPGSGATPQGGADVIHGEAGDDTIAGSMGADVLYGEGQDDDLIGGEGADWLAGGTGDDGMLGDSGKVFTSRNGLAESLYGIAPTDESEISVISGQTTGGGGDGADSQNVDLTATLYEDGKLHKRVDLEPFTLGGDDMLYGGLGHDSLHGGAGNDGLSGSEALQAFYDDPGSTPGLLEVPDVTNPLGTGLQVGEADVTWALALQFLAFDGTPASKIDDGEDKLFGDAGNDWLVGGTMSDHLWGGIGEDVLNADDNITVTDYLFDSYKFQARTAAATTTPTRTREDGREMCPALDDDGRCGVYAFRPLICRSYGVPLRHRKDVALVNPPVIDVCDLNFGGTSLKMLPAGDVFDQTALVDKLEAIDVDHCASNGLPQRDRIPIAQILESS